MPVPVGDVSVTGGKADPYTVAEEENAGSLEEGECVCGVCGRTQMCGRALTVVGLPDAADRRVRQSVDRTHPHACTRCAAEPS
jgi:hypothetical protein